MNKKILIAGLLTLASVAGVVGTVGNASKADAATVTLKGSFDNWGTGHTFSNGRVSVSLKAGTYKFKIVEGSEWMGCNTTIQDSCNDYEFKPGQENGDCTLKITEDGTYIFSYNESTNKLSIDAPDFVDLKHLVDSYYNSGKYVKNTTINLNNDAMNELKTIVKGFHDNASTLIRTTYYTKDALWMSRDDGSYSYYGTDANKNLTNATATEALKVPSNPGIALTYGNNTSTGTWHDDVGGMEGYYITLKDLINTKDLGWSKSGNKYVTSNTKVQELFKAFTAPCYLGFKQNSQNYIIFTSCEIEEVNGQLELRLIAGNESDKLTDGTIFSKAYIEKGSSHTKHIGDYTVEGAGCKLNCLFCNNTKVEDHIGGTATWTEQATCDHCGSKYGNVKPYIVYFTNNKGWSKVNAYYWGGSNPATWPGVAMESVGKNDYGQDIYKIELPTGTTKIIFNNGSEQTVDITITSNGYYLSDNKTNGKYNIGTFTYND